MVEKNDKKIRIFRRTVRKRPPLHHPLLALDIENDPKTGKFINAAVYGYKRIKGKDKKHSRDVLVDEFFTKKEDFTDFLMGLRPEGMKEMPCKLVAFNLSYDLWFFMKITKDEKTLTNGSNIIVAELDNGLKVMDLTNLTRQGSLENWIGYLKDEMSKYGLSGKEPLPDSNVSQVTRNKLLRARVESDAKATWVLGNYLENFFTKEIGIPLKLTIAGAARYLFSLRYFKDYWIREEKDLWKSEYERKAYRGGRVEAFKGGVVRVFVGYDVNSMYLSVMRDEIYPDPNSARYIREPKNLPGFVICNGLHVTNNTLREAPPLYIADVTVNVPKQYIGVLPMINSNNGKLIFPTGTFRGHYASPELNYVIKECGVKVLKIHSLIKYKSKPYFKDYAEFIWKKRKEYKDKHNKGMDILIKYLGNTLYGGFGQKNKDSFFGKLEDLQIVLDADNKDGKDKPIKPHNLRPKVSEIDGVKYVTVASSEGEDSKHTFPCIPVFITSYARLLLLKALRANAENLIYTDTDSMKLSASQTTVTRDGLLVTQGPVTPRGIDVGTGLGEWGYEGVEIDVPVYKSKMYGNKCKGVPKRAVLEWEDGARKIYSYEKPNKMKESFRRGLTPALWKKTIKEVNKIDDKRLWIDEKTSIPLVLEFLEVP